MPDSPFLTLGHDSFQPQLTVGAADEVVLRCGGWSTSIASLAPGVRHALLTLADVGAYEDQLTEQVIDDDGVQGLATFYYYLRLFSRLRLLRRSIVCDGKRLITLVPVSDAFEYSTEPLEPDVQYHLSRFAYARVEAGEMIVESPLAHARLVLHDPRAAALTHTLAMPVSASQASTRSEDLPAGAAAQLMTVMLNAGFLTKLRKSGRSAEHDDPSLRCWEFHDLLFHTRSREGRHDLAIGGTFRFAGDSHPPPALKASSNPGTIPLFRPDLERCREQDPPFALVQDRRCSIRDYGSRPITVDQLGEFLYRTARVTAHQTLEIPTPSGPVEMDFAHRPYAGGGALYELEFYLTVNACDGLASGFYHYDSQRHALRSIAGLTCDVEELLSGASRATGIERDTLQLMVTLAARFQRVAWKYSSIAYATILKNVGVVYQTMYLVATAMELAPCGLGCGNADLFARVAGTNYYEETSVGEFLLGSQPRRQS